MTCNLCSRLLRWDEEQRPTHIEGLGNAFCCPDCLAAARGLPKPEPRRYPVGCRMPQHPLKGDPGSHLPVCGLCRIALPWGQDDGRLLRLRPEFVTEEDDVECGCYRACQECIAKWKPRILIYLKQIGMLAPDATERQIARGMIA